MVRSASSIDSGGCLNCCTKLMMHLETLDVPEIKRHSAWDASSDAEVTPFPTPGAQEQKNNTHPIQNVSRPPTDSSKVFCNFSRSSSDEVALRPPQAKCAHDAPTSRNETRSGRAWAIAIGLILSSCVVSEIRAALHLTSSVVDIMVTSEFGQATIDFQDAVDETRAAWPDIFEMSVEQLISTIVRKFKAQRMSSLAAHVLQYTLSFLSLGENGVLCSVSKDFREAAEGDSLWREAYYERFEAKQGSKKQPLAATTGGSGNPDERSRATKDANRGATGVSTGDCIAEAVPQEFKSRFYKRLLDPQIGDNVEVAWRGKFRLESLEVYNGKAWWLAEIVDKKDTSYQVHYPGWETRWDEWVPRDRLRWGNERRASALRGISAAVGDYVEMWCEGVQVPGAWLEAVVQGVEGGRVNLGKMHTEGQFWVNEVDVRLVKKTSATGCLGCVRGDKRQEMPQPVVGFHYDDAVMATWPGQGYHGGRSSSGNGGCGVM